MNEQLKKSIFFSFNAKKKKYPFSFDYREEHLNLTKGKSTLAEKISFFCLTITISHVFDIYYNTKITNMKCQLQNSHTFSNNIIPPKTALL